eukprot:10127055-Lingulodinium_polyedra.AAC.1
MRAKVLRGEALLLRGPLEQRLDRHALHGPACGVPKERLPRLLALEALGAPGLQQRQGVDHAEHGVVAPEVVPRFALVEAVSLTAPDCQDELVAQLEAAAPSASAAADQIAAAQPPRARHWHLAQVLAGPEEEEVAQDHRRPHDGAPLVVLRVEMLVEPPQHPGAHRLFLAAGPIAPLETVQGHPQSRHVLRRVRKARRKRGGPDRAQVELDGGGGPLARLPQMREEVQQYALLLLAVAASHHAVGGELPSPAEQHPPSPPLPIGAPRALGEAVEDHVELHPVQIRPVGRVASCWWP